MEVNRQAQKVVISNLITQSNEVICILYISFQCYTYIYTHTQFYYIKILLTCCFH